MLPRAMCLVTICVLKLSFRFTFGDQLHSDTLNNGSYVQLLSTSDASEAWAKYNSTRAITLSKLPAEPTIAQLKAALGNPQTYNGTSNSTDSVAANLASSSPNNDGSDNLQFTSQVQRYGSIVVGLLAGNLLVGVALFVIGVAAFLRQAGRKNRSISPTYVQVRFKGADSGLDLDYRD